MQQPIEKGFPSLEEVIEGILCFHHFWSQEADISMETEDSIADILVSWYFGLHLLRLQS